MLYTPHFLTGAAIASFVPNPLLFIPLGVASHILLDLTPHNDMDIQPGITLKGIFKLPKKQRLLLFGVMGADFFLMGIAAFWLLFIRKDYVLFAGGLAGIAPDAIEQGMMLFGKSLPGWFDKLQWRVSKKYGFISYPIVSAIALVLLAQ